MLVRSTAMSLRASFALILVAVTASAGADDARPTTDVRIEETKSYWTSIGVDIMTDATGDPDKRNGLFVISGTLKNVSSEPIRAVLLEFTLVAPDGVVLYRRESFNRAAEALLDVEDAMAVAGSHTDILPIAPGATDSYRMIFIGEEIPAFDHPAVTVRALR
jgi:hypothetical protein